MAMSASPAVKEANTRGKRPAAPPPASAPARTASRTGAAILAVAAGLVVLFALAIGYALPDSLPIVAPAVVLIGALALWGAARVDNRRLAADLERSAAENRRLAGSLEMLADTAWELRESEELYRSLIDAQGDLVVHRDRDGKVTFVNAAFQHLFDQSRDAFRGKPLVLPPLAEAPAEERTAKDVQARDVKLMTLTGPRWFAWVDIRIRDESGTLGPLYSVARDITARKDVEEALVEARLRAEASNQAKSRFLATVSHEFRTPLNGILGLNDLLLETSLTPDQETYARGVQSSGTALLGLIDDLLDFSKIEAGRLDLRPEPTDLEALLQEIVELLAARAHGKGIDIAAHLGRGVPASVMVDGTRLRQILLNLAGNGVKFTETGGVSVSAELQQTGGGVARIAFAVADSGAGIAPEEAERVFGEFEQADSALSRRHGGAGLGLAISRRIVRRMGSDIVLAPGPRGGSIFRFALDLPVVAGAVAATEELAGRRILILAPAGAEPPVLAALLAEAGATARAVEGVHEAAALAAAAVAAALPYDAVLVDQRAVANAGTALARIREGAELPAAILIEPGKRGTIDAVRGAGFDAYLVRPVRRSSLVRVVGDIVAARGDFRVDPHDARPRRPEALRKAAVQLDVLLAEDNEINALLVRAVLEGLGHSVTEVRDGAAAIAAATTAGVSFDAILMDLHMPGCDGLAAARAIREHERLSGTPRAAILALTADVLLETRVEAEAAGIDAVLAKPIAPDSLRRALAGLSA